MNMLHLFNKLALGTKFKYAKENKVWVKIDANTIAEWDESEKASNWIGQRICCFNENDITNIYVDVL